jgi:hypothetical protein
VDVFRDDGHLSRQGMQALLDEQLNETGRLEAAEHLSFCDGCLLRYTKALEGRALMAPPEPTAPKVLKRIRRRQARAVWARYGTVAAAACLAVTIWGVSSFALPRLGGRAAEPRQAAGGGWGEGISHMLDNTAAGLSRFLDGLASRSTQAVSSRDQTGAGPVLTEQQREEKARREEKEKLFERRRQPERDSPGNARRDARERGGALPEDGEASSLPPAA